MRVVAEGVAYYTELFGVATEDLQTLETAARQHTVIALLVVALPFALAALLLPRPAAARL